MTPSPEPAGASPHSEPAGARSEPAASRPVPEPVGASARASADGANATAAIGESPADGQEPHALERLWRALEARRGADPATSYTAALLARAPAKPAQKLAEEAAECAIEAVRGDGAALVRESADLLFHLLVLMAGTGITPTEVYAELVARERMATPVGPKSKWGRSKPARRVRGLGTTKIP